jgi:YkoY family integral membrane protein
MDALLSYLQLTPFIPGDLLVVLVLVVLEGLLSCDNAVVLALLVKPLPPEQRGRALRYGIIGAYVFRIIALILASWIMSKWYLKIAGGMYLLWMGIAHFTKRKSSDAEPEVRQFRRWFGLSPFWSTVVAVELTDIVFSVDSIAAAVALSSKLWVLILGGLLGILAMRFAAQGFVTLLQRFPNLESAAFAAVAFIGLKLLAEFPVDVLGREREFAPGTTYASAAQYVSEVEHQCPPAIHVPHVVSINLAAAPEPNEAAFSDEREFKRARSAWNLHYRPFFEVEGWLSSLIVLGIFLTGFRRSTGRVAEAT